jgi:ribosome modulation factor
VPKSACKYPAGSTLRNEWMEGWTQGLNARPADHSHDAGHEGETRH